VRLTSTKLLIPIAFLVVGTLFWLRPGGISGPSPAPVEVAGKGFDHGPFTAVLKDAVDDKGRINYAALRETPGPLDTYLGMLRAVSPASAPHRFRSNDARLAYYLNAYNAFVLATVRDHCPIENVQKAYFGGGFFWRISFLMGGREITLSTLESERIKAVMQRNPSVRLALAKGATGSPPLGREAFTEELITAQLGAIAKRTVKNPKLVRREGSELQLNAIFQWYETEFIDPIAWVRALDPDLVEGHTTVKYIPYDWTLNGDCGP
jgi:hypothetical protein